MIKTLRTKLLAPYLALGLSAVAGCFPERAESPTTFKTDVIVGELSDHLRDVEWHTRSHGGIKYGGEDVDFNGDDINDIYVVCMDNTVFYSITDPRTPVQPIVRTWNKTSFSEYMDRKTGTAPLSF